MIARGNWESNELKGRDLIEVDKQAELSLAGEEKLTPNKVFMEQCAEKLPRRGRGGFDALCRMSYSLANLNNCNNLSTITSFLAFM